MPRRHPPEVRAAAVAAVSCGEQPAAVARRFGISQGRLHEWCTVDGPRHPELSGSQAERTRERMAGLIYDLLVDTMSTIRLQLRAVGRDEWLAEQTARDVAALLDREFDGAIRLLAGFRPSNDDRPIDDDDERGIIVERPRLGDGERDDRPAD